MNIRTPLVVSTLLAILPAAATAETLLLGSASVRSSEALCVFACAQRFQQLYSATNFSEPIHISEVSFFGLVGPTGATWSGNSSWQMTLSTSEKNVTKQAVGTFGYGGLSQYFADNLGTDQKIFDTQTFTSSAATGERVSFFGSFDYTPTMGDLLIDIQLVSGVRASAFGFQGGIGGSTASSSPVNGLVAGMYSFQSNFAADGSTCDSVGCLELLTEFQVTAVPEPETYAMMLAGLGLVGFMARRRKPAIV